MLRNNTYEVKIGNLYIGKDHKIAIQSMCNIKTSKVDEVVSQILELENEFKEKSEETFINKFDYLNNIEEQHKKVSQLVNATIKMKAKSEFFKEMNRSLSLMTDEYK